MKAGIIGDGAALTTGFAQVIRHVAAELVRRGHDVFQIASLDVPPRCDSRPYYAMGITPYFPRGAGDPIGVSIVTDALRREQPDVVFINTDAGTGYNWLVHLMKIAGDVPTVAYLPVEGAPITNVYLQAFRMASRAFTYTRWSAEMIQKQAPDLDIPWVYHGVDHRTFKPLQPHERRRVRQRLGWDGQFVVMYVARNAERKAHDVLIQALSHLDTMGVRDVTLYLHCKAFDDFELRGKNLAEIAHWYGVSDRVIFPDQSDSARGEDRVTLAEKYAAADLYVSPSKVEGFGLPLIEAMACGLPVMVPADEGNQEEVCGPAGVRLAVNHWDTWFNGGRLACVDARAVAGAILSARAGAGADQSARSLDRARAFRWEPMATTLADACERMGAKEPAYAAVAAGD